MRSDRAFPGTPAELRTPVRSAAETAAHAYAAAVTATELFVAGILGRPTEADIARFTALQERENVAWQRRREAFAALGLHHAPHVAGGSW
ncbi:MAG: hypothetical protein HOV79_10160 [Hamadaea sp.]|nr:hypothetical protein [Hamadaea sp.]